MDALSLYARIEHLVDPAPAADLPALDATASFAHAVLPEGHGAVLEARAELPEAELSALATHGIARELAPHDAGGALDWSRVTRICGRLAAHDLDFTLCLGGAVLGGLPVLVAGDADHRATYFAPLLRGEMGGLGLTEWAHGSDLLAGEATATPIDASGLETTHDAATHFRLSGTKAPINNGSRGACLVLLVRSGDANDPFAQSLFLLSRATPGLDAHARFSTLGHRSMDLSGAILNDVVLPRAAMMGRAGEGFVHARRALEISRSGVAQMAVGPAVTALALAVDHARARHLYGAAIEELGGVRVLLARSFARACASAAIARRAARTIARWAVPGRALSCAAKLVCPTLLEESIAECGTLLGARSLMTDLPFARLRRSAPVLAIFDGSSQLQLDELWRHAATWKDRGSIDANRAREILRTLSEPVDAPFDPHGGDDGEVAATTPLAMLSALAPSIDDVDLAPIVDAAVIVHLAAAGMRGAPQPARFVVSDAAARITTIAALAEARAMADDASAPHIGAALALYVAETAAPLAGLVMTMTPNAAETANAVLALASTRARAESAAFDALTAIANPRD